MCGGASGRIVGCFAVGPGVPLQASTWSLWWVLVPVVRLCVARWGAVGGWLCGWCLAVGVLVEGSAKSQLVFAHAAVVVAATSYSAVHVGHQGAAGRGQARRGSIE